MLPEVQRGFRPDCSTMDMMFVVRRLQEVGRKVGVSLHMCFIDLQKAYDTVAPSCGRYSLASGYRRR